MSEAAGNALLHPFPVRTAATRVGLVSCSLHSKMPPEQEAFKALEEFIQAPLP